MERQRRIAVINDLAGYGKCALSTALPVVSAMGVECCPLPTALLSSNAAFPGYYMEESTDLMERFMEHWEQIGVRFDGAYCGFLGSVRQVELVIRFLEHFMRPDAAVLLDPVMGDHGRLYSASQPEVCENMKRLLPYVDVITPNLTEACHLAGMEYPGDAGGEEEGVKDEAKHGAEVFLEELGRSLCALGPKTAVITGIHRGNQLMNYIYSPGTEPVKVYVNRIGVDRCGTGDAFASIVSAGLVRGMTVEEAVRKASAFLEEVLAYTAECGTAPREGLCFERFLHRLAL